MFGTFLESLFVYRITSKYNPAVPTTVTAIMAQPQRSHWFYSLYSLANPHLPSILAPVSTLACGYAFRSPIDAFHCVFSLPLILRFVSASPFDSSLPHLDIFFWQKCQNHLTSWAYASASQGFAFLDLSMCLSAFLSIYSFCYSLKHCSWSWLILDQFYLQYRSFYMAAYVKCECVHV